MRVQERILMLAQKLYSYIPTCLTTTTGDQQQKVPHRQPQKLYL